MHGLLGAIQPEVAGRNLLAGRPPRGNSWVSAPPLSGSPGGLHGAISDLLRAAGTPFHVFEPALEVSGPCPLRRLQEKENIYWGKDPPGPSAPTGCPGLLNPAERPGRGHRRTRAANSAHNAARVFTRGRGSKRREGPQASTLVGRPDPARGQGLAPPLVRSPFCTRTPMRDGLGWRDF
ncbi:hypothetical protein NDU88_006186 [Pleurodeles waltl]|uniref:Uncharacterized protein n=1 Tax=Pleurodeles waltl TaxID=8319 RepID=A0AAV7WCQ6_PLEWA|nr:hypothetical protein NDU88_006186 [Pleurodeles waltl]